MVASPLTMQGVVVEWDDKYGYAVKAPGVSERLDEIISEAEHQAAHAELVQPPQGRALPVDAPDNYQPLGEEVRYSRYSVQNYAPAKTGAIDGDNPELRYRGFDTMEIKRDPAIEPAEYKLVPRRVRITDGCDLPQFRGLTGDVVIVTATWDGVEYTTVKLDHPVGDADTVMVFSDVVVDLDGDASEEHF